MTHVAEYYMDVLCAFLKFLFMQTQKYPSNLTSKHVRYRMCFRFHFSNVIHIFMMSCGEYLVLVTSRLKSWKWIRRNFSSLR